MPDLKIHHPQGMLPGGAKQYFKQDAAAITASALDCNDYGGAPVRVEVTGYDYPNRMFDIEERLGRIKASLSRKVRSYLELTEDDTAVTVSFIPIPNGCWV